MGGKGHIIWKRKMDWQKTSDDFMTCLFIHIFIAIIFFFFTSPQRQTPFLVFLLDLLRY